MRLQLKRSDVVSSGSAVEPTADSMADGELAINYNKADPCLFIKTTGNEVVRLSQPLADLPETTIAAGDFIVIERGGKLYKAKVDPLI